MSSLVNRLIDGFVNCLRNERLDDKTVLDLGCGFGTWGHMMRTMAYLGGHKSYIVGCDIFIPYLKIVKKHNPYDDLVLCDARFPPFRDKSVDIIIAFELIEHLEKQEARWCLANWPKLCRKSIFVSTPYGWLPQEETRDNKFQKHRSAWTEGELKRMSYKVVKCGIGANFENILNRLHLFGFLHRVTRWRFHGNWGGIMIIAKKELST